MNLSSYPHLVKEWHPTKNGELTPNDVTFGSSKKIWWLCSNGHSFISSANRRTSMMTNCPFCQGRKAGDDNNLSVVFPEIAKEWHPTKNGELKPENYTRGSKKKVWWLCPKGHSYETTIKIRTMQKSGCTFCSRQSSAEELRILSELRWIFKEVNNRHKIDGKEVDIFIPSLNIGIEFDGSYWHKDKKEADLEKNKHLLSRGIQLIRVRQHPLKSLSKNDIVVSNKQLIKEDVNKILNTINLLTKDINLNKINEYLNKPSFVNEELFREYKSYFPLPLPEHSLAILNPLISDEWNYEKNYPLTPKDFTYASNYKVWWICSKGHNYEAVIANRARGTKCPLCSGRRAGDDNNLELLFPDIAKEWHPTKNGSLKPANFTRGSEKKVWWLCPKGHSYSSMVKSRTSRNTGCSYCAGKKTSKENNLLILFPEVAKEWHPTKNKELSPNQVVSKSGKKAWWLCPKGHSYDSKISNRTANQSGCPYCAGQKSLNLDLFN